MKKNNNNIKNSSSFESVVREASQKEKSTLRLSKTYPAMIVLVMMLGISFFIFDALKTNIAKENQQNFDNATKSVMTRLTNHQNNLMLVIGSVAGVYDLVIEVVSDFFRLYATVPASNYKSILSIDYIPKVPAKELGVYNYLTQCEGYYTYHVFPENLLVDYYYPIKHIVPLEKNEHKQGFDLNTQPEFSSMISIMQDSMYIGATEFYNVRPDTLGFYLLRAVYKKDSSVQTVVERRKNFKGLVGVEIDAKTYFLEALRGEKQHDKDAIATDQTIIFEITERVNGEKKSIYQSENYNLADDKYKAKLTSLKPFKLANKELMIEFCTVPDFGGKLQNNMPAIVFLISLILSIAFFGFVLSVITARARALNLAERMTQAQRRIVDSSHDIIGVLDFEGRWKSVNQSSMEIFGYKYEQLQMTSFKELLFDEEGQLETQKIFKKATEIKAEEFLRVDLKMKNTKNELVWMDWNFTFSPSDQLIYAIGRNVTIEKQAEKQAIIRRKQTELAEQFTREISESKTLFMIKLSHHLRNSLTGISGYLQLLQDKLYDDAEEMDSYINEAIRSSEELFTYTSGFVDGAIEQDASANMKLEIIHVKDILEEIGSQNKTHNTDFHITYNEECNVYAMADKMIFTETIRTLIELVSYEIPNAEIIIQGVMNTYEHVAELQIMGPASKDLDKFINIYKKSRKQVIDILDQDQDDILFRFAKSASNIRRLNGSILIESFGAEDGSLIQLNMPVNESIG